LKTVALGHGGTPTSVLTLTLYRGATAYGLLTQSFGIGVSYVVVPLYVILAPGDALRAQTDQGVISIWASGVELEGVAP